MYFNGAYYYDDNGTTCPVNTYITMGDWDRLSYIGRVNNLNIKDPINLISYVIREYCKEHDIENRMSKLTGKQYKTYEEYLAYFNERH